MDEFKQATTGTGSTNTDPNKSIAFVPDREGSTRGTVRIVSADDLVRIEDISNIATVRLQAVTRTVVVDQSGDFFRIQSNATGILEALYKREPFEAKAVLMQPHEIYELMKTQLERGSRAHLRDVKEHSDFFKYEPSGKTETPPVLTINNPSGIQSISDINRQYYDPACNNPEYTAAAITFYDGGNFTADTTVKDFIERLRRHETIVLNAHLNLETLRATSLMQATLHFSGDNDNDAPDSTGLHNRL